MAFTGSVSSINRNPNSVSIGVTWADSASNWSIQKTYDFPDDGSMTALQIKNQLLGFGTVYKNNLTQGTTLQSFLGTVVTI